MDENDKQAALRGQIEELVESLQKLSEKQNSHYTDIMLALKKIEEQTVNEVDDMSEEELLEDAKEMAIDFEMISASLLQRTLRIGYARAARLLDLLEVEGVIDKAEGNRPRKVLIKE